MQRTEAPHSPPRFFDTAAGLPLHPEAQRWMVTAWESAWASPEGRSGQSQRTSAVLQAAQQAFAQHLGCSPDEVAFAPDPDLALHVALLALAGGRRTSGLPVVVGAIERRSVLRAADRLAEEGFEVRVVPVDELGRIDGPALGQPAAVVAVQHANREIGTVQQACAVACVPADVPLLVDATMARSAADLPSRWDALVLDPRQWGAPGGAAVLAVRSGRRWQDRWGGGPRERTPGGVPAPLAAAAAMTFPPAGPLIRDEDDRLRMLADQVRAGLRDRVGLVELHGDEQHRLSWLVSASLLYVSAEELLDALAAEGFAIGSGSACTSDTRRPSHVLTAIGALTSGNLRISLPPGARAEELEDLVDAIARHVAQQRRDAGVVP